MKNFHSKEIKVSIIIPAYNAGLFLERAIRSCINQSISREKFEIIVVNDCSKDATNKICKLWGNEIIYLENKMNKGLPYTLNKGVESSKGLYIVRLDADDFLHEDFLKILSVYLDLNADIQLVECDYFIYKKYNRTRCSQIKNPIGCANMIRKDYLVSIGLYNVKFKMAEEIELRARMDKDLFGYINMPLYRYYKHNSNMTLDKKKYNRYKKKIK
mgnify:FL=1